MNKKGFIEMDDLSPIAVALGFAGGLLGFWVSGFYEGAFFWRILSGAGSAFGSWFIVQRMSE